MFEQSFKNIDNILHTDSGCGTELDYVEQTSWILFLKYLDDLEETKKTESALAGKKYKYILSSEFRWNAWACPKDANGKLDHHKALDADLNDFVNNKLFPHLKKFRSEEPSTIEYKIGEIFGELKNINILKRFYKIYTNDFAGAARLRALLMEAKTYPEVYQIIQNEQFMD